MNTTIEWILTGKQSELQGFLNRDEQELIEKFRKMDDRDKLDLLDNARVKVDRHLKEQAGRELSHN